MKSRLLYLSVVLFVFCSLAYATTDMVLIDQAKVIADAAQVTLENYPNADQVQVDDYTLVQYESDGTDTQIDESYIKILTEKARRNNQSQQYHFTLPYDELNVELIEIIKPDGTKIPIDVKAQSKVMIDRSQMGMNIYNPNSKILVVGVPGLDVGDLLHVLVRRSTVKTRMPNSWSDYQVFEYYNPIRHMVYEIYAPLDLPLAKTMLKDKFDSSVVATKQERNVELLTGGVQKRIDYKWEVSNVDQIYPEPDMPAYYTVVQRLLVSTNPSWQSVSRWYWSLVEPHLKCSQAMKDKVADLIAGKKDRMAKIREIFKFVSQDVRYLGITVEDTAPGYEPHDAQMTFDNRHGVCRDKAALLVAMLREAGFDAYPVLIYSGPKKDPEVAQPYFNHAISAIRNDDGSFMLMDSTDESTKSLLPSYLNDCSYLVATPEGEDLRVSPIVPAEKNMLTITTDAQIDSEGVYSAHSKIVFNGINDNAYRGYFARISQAQRREYFESLVSKIIPGAKLKSFTLLPNDMLNTEEKLQVDIEYEADDIIVGGHGDSLLPLFMIGNRVGIVNFVLGKTGLQKRRFPLETRYTCGVKEDINIQLDPKIGDIVALPHYSEINDNTITWKREFIEDGSAIKGSGEFVIKVVRFAPDEYRQLKQTLKDIEFNQRKMAIIDSGSYLIKRKQADVAYRSIDKSYSLEDENNWKLSVKVVKEILTYKGKKDSAELKFNYNPAWESVRLIGAKVINGDSVKEISNQEINVMDASWSGSAPRYPAAKTLVASLPGVEIGSVIEYEYERVFKDRAFFDMQEVFASYDALDKKTLHISYPKELDKKIKSVIDPDGFSFTGGGPEFVEAKKVLGDRIVETIEFKNQAPLKREVSTAPLRAYVPVARMSSGDWREYCKTIMQKIEDASREQKLSIKGARDLTAHINLKRDKVIAIRDYVAKNIRNVPVSFDSLPLSAISSADTTLKDAYGNTTDKAILLYTMLRAVGIDCEIVLASRDARIDSLEAIDREYPSTDTFSVALVRVDLDSNKFYLNDTNQYAKLGTTPSREYQIISLKDAKIESLELAKQDQTHFDDMYDITINEDASADIKVSSHDFGVSFEMDNKMYSEMPPEQRNRYYQELVAELSQSALASSELKSDFSNYPGLVSYAVNIDRFAVVDTNYMYITLPEVFGDIFGLKSDKRETPFYNSDFLNYTVQMDVELPQSYKNILLCPESQVRKIPNDSGTIEIDSQRLGETKLRVVYKVNLKPSIIPSSDYDQLFDISTWLSKKDNRMILLER